MDASITTLENWNVFPPTIELTVTPRRSRLHGEAINHPRFPDGTLVDSSPIVGRDGDLIVTKSGSRYRLGAPCGFIARHHQDATKEVLARVPEAPAVA